MPSGRASTSRGRSRRWASASRRRRPGSRPRWVVWSAASTLRGVVGAGIDVARTWDLAETHRIIHGGWAAAPGDVLAGCRGLDPADVPQPRAQRLRGFDGDLFDLAEGGDATLLTADGHLRADALTRATDEPQLRELARARARVPGVAARGAGAPRRRARRAPRAHGVVRVGGGRALPRARARRAPRRPARRRGPHRRLGRAARPRRGRRRPHPRRARPRRAAARPGTGAPRPAQPDPGARAARLGGRRRAQHPRLGARALPRSPTRSSTRCCAGARTSASPRPTATGGSTSTWAPTTGSGARGPPATARRGA